MFRVNKFTEMAWNFLCSEAASEWAQETTKQTSRDPIPTAARRPQPSLPPRSFFRSSNSGTNNAYPYAAPIRFR
jgi:hypothetical protein